MHNRWSEDARFKTAVRICRRAVETRLERRFLNYMYSACGVGLGFWSASAAAPGVLCWV
ncbi:MAG: hypothetical protein ACO2PN_14025 [Pyrobaculum sp.]